MTCATSGRVGDRPCVEIVVDAHEKLGQQISAPVYVSDGIVRLPAGTHGLALGASDASNFHAKTFLPNKHSLPAKRDT
jgi:hypothetical protein